MTETETFINILDPEDTTTGGGSASALSGAMAGALTAMVCLVCAKSPEAAGAAGFEQRAAQAKALSETLLAGGRADSLAFQAVRAAYRLPRESAEQKAARSEAVQAAWVGAARVPLANAAACFQVAALAVELEGLVLPQVRSDLVCAMLLARAGALGCLENIAINLPSIKDAAAAAGLAEEAAGLRRRLDALKFPY